MNSAHQIPENNYSPTMLKSSILVMLLISAILIVMAPDNLSARDSLNVSERDSVRVIKFQSRKNIPQHILALPSTIWTQLYKPLGEIVIWGESNRIDRRVLNILMNEDRTAGIFPIASIGGKNNFSAGIALFDNNLRNKEISISSFGLYHNPDNIFVGAKYRMPVSNNSGSLGVSAILWSDDEEVVYGIGGNSSLVNDSLAYGIDDKYIEIDWTIKWEKESGRYVMTDYQRRRKRGRANHFTTKLFLRFSEVNIDEGLNRYPTVPTTILGYGNTTLFETGIQWTYDTRNHEFNPRMGNLLRLFTEYTRQMNGSEFRYLRYTVEYQKYIELFKKNRVFAFRVILDGTARPKGKVIPFYRMSILGSHDTLRGFKEGRFRDFGSLLANFEYRYPIWDSFDGVIFLDTGQVYKDLDDVKYSSLHTGYGAGVRLRLKNSFLARIQVGYSSEGHRTVAQFSQIFN